MASINNITLKNIKSFIGHEGECLQGNIYLGTKKIGFWSQDFSGGPDVIELDSSYSENKLEEKIHVLNKHKDIHGTSYSGEPYTRKYNFERLASDLVSLIDAEKAYKNAVKKGYSALLRTTDGYHIMDWYLPESYAKTPLCKILEEINFEKEKEKAGFFKENYTGEHEVRIYRNETDFILGEKIQLDDIRK